MLAFEEDALEPLSLDGETTVPLIRMTAAGLPDTEISVAGRAYTYERSYNIKGSSAVMPRFVHELMNAGKAPLVIERPTRYYVYSSA